MEKSEVKVLEAVGLTKYYTEEKVFDSFNFSVHQGEVLVILGASGCGKSTLLRCLNGLEPIQAGEIKLDGKVIDGKQITWQKARQKIGMVFQSYELFSHLTILENILLGPMKAQGRERSEVIKQAEYLLNRVGLIHKKDAYPRQLSGGQKQRIAIVRSLCMNPEIMLFDEVTASLDPEMVREVLDLMLELARQGMTMVIVTHEMEFAKAVADRVLFLDGGKIVEDAVAKQFFTSPKTQRAQRFLNRFDFKIESERVG
ncbi:amino acid ABC transporter ATP-binding protein [Anaerosinus sp.]|uniref:amino acid ABC transporter ATP-binding protein n=1 Tax=Selenobaculum sp. TaxID=3074374 RepID=UPI0015A95369